MAGSISRSRGSVAELYDLERVEVLKGPQETLFGRGAEIGAISLISNKPTSDFDASSHVGAGGFGALRSIHGFINVPIIDDKVLFRLAAIKRHRDGYIENIAGWEVSMGTDRHTPSSRPSFRFLPTDNLTIDLVYNYQRDDDPGTDFKNNVIAPPGGDTSPFTAADLDQGNALGVRRKRTAQHHRNRGLGFRAGLEAGARSPTIAGTIALNLFDADGSQLRSFQASELYRARQFSQELRVNYDEGVTASRDLRGAISSTRPGSSEFGSTTDERIHCAWC